MNRIISIFALSAYVLAVGSALFVASTQNSYAAGPDTPPELHAVVLEKARQDSSGVIVAVSQRGEQAAQAAYLLSAQIRNNQGYAPLLVLAEEQSLSSQLQSLELTPEQLPALIFFNQHGHEVSRVVFADGQRKHSTARLAYTQSVTHNNAIGSTQ